MPDFPDLPEIEASEDRDGYARLIAAVTVVTTLLAAVTAVLQAESGRRDDETSMRAERLSARALGERLDAQAGAESQYERFQLAQIQRRRAVSAYQLKRFRGSDRRRNALAEARWRRIAAATESSTARLARDLGFDPITVRSAYGPERDPAFPARYFSRHARGSIYFEALKDGANAEGDRAERQTSAYAVSLTLFAVAVFLFGYSLTPQGRRRAKLFAGTAAVFVLGSSTWTAATAIDAPERRPDEAAAAYADGVTAIETHEYQSAIAHFDRAIDLHDDYAQAYAGRASARVAVDARNPSSAATTRQIVSDLERALELDEGSATYQIDLGVQLFRLGLAENDDEKLERALELTRLGKVAFDSFPDGDYNEAAILLALGRTAEARARYDEAVGKTRFLDAAEEEERDDRVQRTEFVSAALTDLELIRHASGDELAGEIRAIKERIITPISAAAKPWEGSRDEAPPQSERVKRRAVRLARVRVLVDPAGPQWKARAPELDLAKDRIYTVWYHRNPFTGSWTAAPAVSGERTTHESGGRDGGVFLTRYYIGNTLPPECTPEGEWRAEIYVNGRYAGSGTGSAKYPKVRTVRAPDIGVATCVPMRWRPAGRSLGLTRGWVSRDGESGVFIWSLNKGTLDTGSRSAHSNDRLLVKLVKRLVEPKLPARIARSRYYDDPFMGLDGETARIYWLKGGGTDMEAGLGFRDSGELVLGYAFGPATSEDRFSEAVTRTFYSFTLY